MKNTTIGLWACTVSLLTMSFVGDGSAGAATAGHKSEQGGPAGRSHEASKTTPKGPIKPDSQPDIGTGETAQPTPTPSNKTQMVEERLRRGDIDEASAQGQISDRLDQFYQESERLPGRQASGPSDR